jgi:hypothetical protein
VKARGRSWDFPGADLLFYEEESAWDFEEFLRDGKDRFQAGDEGFKAFK